LGGNGSKGVIVLVRSRLECCCVLGLEAGRKEGAIEGGKKPGKREGGGLEGLIV